MPWSDRFEDPVPGLETLRQAAQYIQKLPASEQALPHWQAAVEALIMAAEGRAPLLLARIGMLRAMSYGKPAPAKEPRRKAVKAYRVVR
jgi:hypothetical protein